MNIECPICSTAIEVSKSQTGQKGRCVTCETKFIIPESPDDECEILVRGEAPEESEKETDKAKPDSKPALKVPAGRRQQPTARSARIASRSKKSGASEGLMIAAAAAIVVGGYFALSKMDGVRKTNKGGAATEQKPNATAPTASRPKPLPAPAPAPVVTEPQPDPQPNVVAAPDPDPEPPSAPEPPPEEKKPALSEEKKARALAYLTSKEESKRKGAYTAFRKLGDDEKTAFGELLAKAKDHHLKQIGDYAFDLSIGDNALADFKDKHDEWQDVMSEARSMVQTNWKDKAPKEYKQKHAEMDRLFGESAQRYKGAVSSAGRAARFDFGRVEEHLVALGEIDAELAWCEGGSADGKPELIDAAREAGGADGFVKILGLIDSTQKIAADRDAVAKHNSGSSWASGAYKSFAELLNDRRVALGLGALRLDENLSKACVAHSGDMAANNYFSHTGLTPETKSFGQRAKRAGFSGGPSGECIFMGNPSPTAAHQAWWYSDGHRLIMYSGGPNTLGLGLHGKHWTLNTGRKSW